MKILTQGRNAVVDAGREIRIIKSNELWSIESYGRIKDSLASYPTEKRAKEVLSELFQFVRTKKNTYIMPEE